MTKIVQFEEDFEILILHVGSSWQLKLYQNH